jgi:hypothetical protein
MITGQGHDVSGWVVWEGGGLNKTQDRLEEFERCSEWRSGFLAFRSSSLVSVPSNRWRCDWAAMGEGLF